MAKKALFLCALFLMLGITTNSGEPAEFKVREVKVSEGFKGRGNAVFEIQGHGRTCYVFGTPGQQGLATTLLWCEPDSVINGRP
jgi:hypothetical protein